MRAYEMLGRAWYADPPSAAQSPAQGDFAGFGHGKQEQDSVMFEFTL
jgi:hypothetical protein